MINDGTELYDYAAGKLIAVEAGARVTGFDGNPDVDDSTETFLLSNGTSIHEFLLDRVTRPIIGG